jgi:hypothetical protein
MSSRALIWPRTVQSSLRKVSTEAFLLARALSLTLPFCSSNNPPTLAVSKRWALPLAGRFRPPPIGRSIRVPTFRPAAKAMTDWAVGPRKSCWIVYDVVQYQSMQDISTNGLRRLV